MMDSLSDLCDDMDVNHLFKTCVAIIVDKLSKSESVCEYDFPTSFTANQRKFVTNYCANYGLKTKTRRNGSNRVITAYKSSSTIISSDSSYDLSSLTLTTVKEFLRQFPVTDKERKESTLSSNSDQRAANSLEAKHELNCTTGRLSNIIPQIPNPPIFASGRVDEMVLFRQSLPVWKVRQEITEAIASNRIILISGQSGSGKTTQIPQFILEYCNLMKKACRIICAEPRSLFAHSVAERVSKERQELIGQTVGYQIRLESKVSPRTLLTFCTNGVLLRTLMGGENPLQSVTHLIIDEIQECDRFSEFLLLVMRELMSKYKNFKLILMSANNELIEYYSKYFDNCPIIQIEGDSNGGQYQYLYLEDSIRFTDYMSEAMKRYKESMETKETKKETLKEWIRDINVSHFAELSFASGDIGYGGHDMRSYAFGNYRPIGSEKVIAERDELTAHLINKMDKLLRSAWTQGSDYAFEELFDFINNEQISVDYQHSVSGVTALIVAISHNKIGIVESLLSFGANINLFTANDWNAIQWAQHFGHKELTELLETFCKCLSNPIDCSELTNLYKSSVVVDEDKQLLDLYYHSQNDINGREVDIDLICHLIDFIITNSVKSSPDQKNGSILVLLADYDEIIKLRGKIVSDSKRFDQNKYVLFTVYPQMPNMDLKRVFRQIPENVHKIILSTSITETCISIDGVFFVIDSGRVTEKIFDKSTGFATHATNWISKTNAIQRRNRFNRSKFGICFHLYDRNRFSILDDFQVSDMNKMSIHELCLQTKLLAPGLTVYDFLSKALKPPSMETIKKSVQLLKTIDALEMSEQLTELGLHLLDLPIEPNLGKMVLYSVVLKCLDPVLTIVCSLSYRNPFVVPQTQASRRRSAFSMRRKLSAKTFSDHISLLRAFQSWQKAKCENFEKQFCEQNFISSAAMEMIVNMRAQLLGQLRASGFVRARGPGDIRDLNANSENWAVVKSALCAGGYPYIIHIDRNRNQLMTQNEVNVRFHPNSVLNPNTCAIDSRESVDLIRAKYLESIPTDWLLFNDMTKRGNTCYVECCTVITPQTVALFAGNIQTTIHSYYSNLLKPMGAQFGDDESDSESEDKIEKDKHVFKIDKWIHFKVEPEIAELTLQLRQKWNSLFLRRMCSPSKPMTPADDLTVKAIVELLTFEEKNYNLQQPVGIGQRPRPMSTDFCPPVSNIPLNSPLNESLLQMGRQVRVSPQTDQTIPSSLIQRNPF